MWLSPCDVSPSYDTLQLRRLTSQRQGAWSLRHQSVFPGYLCIHKQARKQRNQQAFRPGYASGTEITAVT
jgi:hypothetical protein